MRFRRAEATGAAIPVQELCRYGVSGGAAVVVHLAALMLLVEAFAYPKTLASAAGFACATLVNYALQHRFVFRSTSRHSAAFPRYLGITLSTLALNTGVFWFLTDVLGVFYLASQVLTIGILVPTNFTLHRVVTFARA